MEAKIASLPALLALCGDPELLSEAERSQLETWLMRGLVARGDDELLRITQLGEDAYWSHFHGKRAQEVMDLFDENIMGVLADVERGLTLADIAALWSGGVLLLTGHDVLSTFQRWMDGQGKYPALYSALDLSRVISAYKRITSALSH
ncbi:hypothetical protein [Pandoraea sp. ISTKB]|uniref:hypothetical protein n=1 Tax=Pandoraea sp. ISTKB TaxID=1586708 RepID=UPI0008479857|nr:hypothetical protein [Pandoraea sp. ISTKB]ODP34996.1 hypothetical protein A9762_11550 [Pandoraea sp. ISTKB]